MRVPYIIILCFLIIGLNAQNKTPIKGNNKANQPFYKTKNSDLFYIGVDNRFILYKDPAKKYSVSVKNGAIIKKDSTIDSNIYFINVKNSEPTFVNVNVDGKTYSYKFRNRKIPSPEIKILLGIEFSKATEISVEKFINAKSLCLELNDFDFDVSMKIVGMQLVIIRNGQKEEHLLLDQNIEKYVKNCFPGDIYIFKDIVIEYLATGTQRTLNSKTFFVK